MAGIADPGTIDLIAEDAGGSILLVIVQSEPWTASEEISDLLMEKIANYVSVIEDGTLEAQFPSARGRPITIELRCLQAPSGHIAHILEHTRVALNKRGLTFRWATLSHQAD